MCIEVMHSRAKQEFETSVLKQLLDGKNNHHVALALRISESTVARAWYWVEIP
jgi:DNA-binding NarL/FixJ family response regulator